MQVSRRAYYDWKRKPAKIIGAQTLHLYRRLKTLFIESRRSMGSRELVKNLRKEGFTIGRYKVRKLMKNMQLKVLQRQAYRITTHSDHHHPVAENILSRNFNPEKPNQVWSADITYLKTGEGWLYLAIVMDLYSRRIIGWSIDKKMKQGLAIQALQMAITLRQPGKGIIHHSDQGSQYACGAYQKLLKKNGFIVSMSRKGNCWDNAVVERFFGSLKHEWLRNIYHLKRQTMRDDVRSYIRYYNGKRLHSALSSQTPIEAEFSFYKLCGNT